MIAINFSFLFLITILLVFIVTALNLILKNTINSNTIYPVSNVKTVLLCVFVLIIIGFYPIELGSDKSIYLKYFNHYNESTLFEFKDVGWYYYIIFCRAIFYNATFFFFITSLLYFLGYFVFIKKLVNNNHLFFFLLTIFGSLGYLGYGVNTIRAGLALSFLLIAISNSKINLFFIFFSIISISIHKSMMIPLAGFILTFFLPKNKIFIYIWFTFLVISIVKVDVISNFISDLFVDTDSRVGEYLNAENTKFYKTGFRYDFLFYSLISIVCGYYYIYKLKFTNTLYNRLFNVYLFANAFWLLLIRIPFNDRFAYLSWFLQPFLILYPLFYKKNIKNRQIKVALSIGILILINFILNI